MLRVVRGSTCRTLSLDWLSERDCSAEFRFIPSFLLRHKFSLSYAGTFVSPEFSVQTHEVKNISKRITFSTLSILDQHSITLLGTLLSWDSQEQWL